MTLLDNKMTECLFNIAQFLNSFNAGNEIKPDVKVELQAPLSLYHQLKDKYHKILADNPGPDSISTEEDRTFAKNSLKFIKLNALLNQSQVPEKVTDLNNALTTWIDAETPSEPVVADVDNPDSGIADDDGGNPDDNNNGNG
jgi:hypothetical protein